jgi:hypothetical protein
VLGKDLRKRSIGVDAPMIAAICSRDVFASRFCSAFPV